MICFKALVIELEIVLGQIFVKEMKSSEFVFVLNISRKSEYLICFSLFDQTQKSVSYLKGIDFDKHLKNINFKSYSGII